MKLLRIFPATCLFLVGPLLVVPMMQSQAVAVTRRPAAHEMSRGYQRAHQPRTIWERMRDPRGAWQGRLAKSNQQGGSPRLHPSASGVRPFVAEAIANPIFFIPPTYSSGGRSARNIEIGDFNGDGEADLLVSNQCVSDADCTQSTVAVLPGNGDGTYQPAVVSNTGAVVSSVAIGDFNRDGKLDVAVDNECLDPCSSGSVNILLGKGDGTFQPPVSYSSGGNAFSVEAGDVNGDGKLDLLVVNGSSSVGVLLGNGDGTFQAVSSVSSSSLPGISAVFLGDFNGDNKPDLAVVTSSCDATPTCTRSVNVLPGNGDGSFGAPVGNQSTAGVNPQAVALGDVNGDGKLDLAVVDSCVPATATCVNETVDVFLGNGDGTFKTAVGSVLGTNDVTFIGFGDLNGNGKADAVTVDPDAASAALMVGAGDGTFQLVSNYETEGTSPLFGVLGDLNRDGKNDLAVANACQTNFLDTCTGTVVALLGIGAGTFAGPVSFPAGGGFPASTAVDLNHDGKPDLVMANRCTAGDCTNGNVAVLLNDDDNGTFRAAVTYSTGGFFAESVAAGDFNGDGKADVVVVNQCVSLQDCTHGVLGVLLGNGDGTLQAPVLSPSGGASPKAVAVGDFNGDGKLDLALAQCSDSNACFDGSNGSVSVLLGNGDGTFQAAVSYSSGDRFATAVAVADFNADGKLDLAVANGNCSLTPDGFDVSCLTGSVGVLLGNGDGSFQAAVGYSSVDDQAFSLVVGDFNGDGKLDLAVGNDNCNDLRGCFSGSVALLLGKGDGTFGSATTYATGDPWPVNQSVTRASAMAVADFNGDGKLDLALSNRNILLGNGDGSFQAPQSYNPVGDLGASTVVADFNSDGKPDLAVTNASQVTLLLNISTGFQRATSTALVSSRNPVNFHHRVTFTATVTSTSQGTLTGTITFSDGEHALATESISDGQAKFTTSSLDGGLHAITASYSGDETFQPSTSAALNQVVRAETSTRLTSSLNPSRPGQPVTLTAVVVANSGATPTGTVKFKNFSTTLATVQLSDGQATFTTSRLHQGPHRIRADYGGSSTDRCSSAIIVQRVR